MISWIKSVATRYNKDENTKKANTGDNEPTNDTSINESDRINIEGTDTNENQSKMQKSAYSPSSKNCISDDSSFCKMHQRIGKLIAVTKKDIKLDENSKK